MVGHFSGTKIGMLTVFMGTCNTGLLFGPIVFFLAYSTDATSLTFLRDRYFISYVPKAVFITRKYAANMNNLIGTGTMTNQSFHRLEMDAGRRAV